MRSLAQMVSGASLKPPYWLELLMTQHDKDPWCTFTFPAAEHLHPTFDCRMHSYHIDGPLFNDKRLTQGTSLRDCYLVCALDFLNLNYPNKLAAILQPLSSTFVRVFLGNYTIHMNTRIPYRCEDGASLGISPCESPGCALIEKAFIIYWSKRFGDRLHYDTLRVGGYLENAFDAVLPGHLRMEYFPNNRHQRSRRAPPLFFFSHVKCDSEDPPSEDAAHNGALDRHVCLMQTSADAAQAHLQNIDTLAKAWVW